MTDEHQVASGDCRGPHCGCRPDRRAFLHQLGASGGALVGSSLTAVAGPFDGPSDSGPLEASAEFEHWVPAEKKFLPEWLASLTARGEPERYSGEALRYLGMPVGGLFAGMLYLGGDGRLWLWNIFNRDVEGVVPRQVEYAGAKLGARDGALFVAPAEATSPVSQGFSLRWNRTDQADDAAQTTTLDQDGFRKITFTGSYPIGTVEYRDPEIPLTARLEAFSPFIPLNLDDSSLPATILEITLHNTSSHAVRATLTAWLENAVCLHHRDAAGTRRNEVRFLPWGTLALATAAAAPTDQDARPDLVVEDWQADSYTRWEVEGTAFGQGPVAKRDIPDYQGDVGGPSERVVNSHATAPGDSIGQKDSATGKLTSHPFVIERDYLHLWIGGGGHQDRTCVNLVVEGQRVAQRTGRHANRMERESIVTRQWLGKSARLEIVDAESGAWGNIGVGRIDQSDQPLVPLAEQFDYGSMGLALVGARADAVSADYPVQPAAPQAQAAATEAAQTTLDRPLAAALGRTLTLEPGAQATLSFVIAWHFPNLRLGPNLAGRSYAAQFASAADVADYVARNFQRLAETTRLWRDTWYDSTLPYWFLNRTFANTSTLATTTCYRLRDGRFWAWEGVGCCPGTCTHVWHYAQAPARLFPALERDQRERVDFGLALNDKTGIIGMRAEHGQQFAVDGQCGAILRAYREHQMSASADFLRRLWPGVKRAVLCLLDRDREQSGVLRGPMHNTLDADWYGVVPWLVGMYHAALRAAEQMATEMGEPAMAERCRRVLERGIEELDRLTWSERHGYYLHRGDPQHASEVGSYDGCHIDQVLGQSWSWQVGLGAVAKSEHVRRALASLWRFNLAPDVGPFRAANKPGRWYAMPGDGGLLMVTFPFGRPPQVTGAGAWSAMYFNECMSGFEWQVAAHMLWEGMLIEGLAIARLIHDRYHPRLRNPYNEIECSDHYARAMASYGAFLAVCGFEYHGPQGRLGFAPRMPGDAFRAAFTTAEAWGSIAQQRAGQSQVASVMPKWGQLRLRQLDLELPPGAALARVEARLRGKALAAVGRQLGRRVEVTLRDEATLDAGDALEVTLWS